MTAPHVLYPTAMAENYQVHIPPMGQQRHRILDNYLKRRAERCELEEGREYIKRNHPGRVKRKVWKLVYEYAPLLVRVWYCVNCNPKTEADVLTKRVLANLNGDTRPRCPQCGNALNRQVDFKFYNWATDKVFDDTRY